MLREENYMINSDSTSELSPPAKNGNKRLAARVPAIEQALASRLAETSGVLGVVVGTADGRALAHAGASSEEFQPARIAAIASSLLALSESFSRETLGGTTRYSSVATSHGSILMVRVPGKSASQVLCLWADAKQNLGMALNTALGMAARVAGIVDDI